MVRDKKVCFVAAASEQIGAGHVARCARYALHLNSLGYQTHIRGEISLSWLKNECRGVFKSHAEIDSYENFDVLVLDSYDEDFLFEASRFISAQIKIQIADFYTPIIRGFEVVWLDVTQPLAIVPSSTQVIGSGLGFFPIANFSKMEFRQQASNVLLVTGATNNSKIIDWLAASLDLPSYYNLHFHGLVSDSSKALLPSNWTCYPIGPVIKDLVSFCDTVISASGTSMWDFIANGLPMGVMQIASNQFENYSYAIRHNLAIGLDRNQDDASGLDKALKTLFFDSKMRARLVQNGLEHVDFRGIERFAKLITQRIP
jgi:spore coat polysaccharide biosynthesis predicted glycosyltransferase SpsG